MPESRRGPCFRPRLPARGGARRFSLVELVIVIAVLGVLATLLFPAFGETEGDAKSKVAQKEMADLRRAFQSFYGDCVPADDALKDAIRYGLWPLFAKSQTGAATTFADYDPARRRGWRGPYAETEGSVEIDTNFSATVFGQREQGGGTAVPVVLDPYAADAVQSYYRVLAPYAAGDYPAPGRLALVCTGPNRLLETTETNLDANGDLVAQGDDTVSRLLPMAE